MAESLDDGEFWLPPQFLTDDDILMDMSYNIKMESDDNDKKEEFDLDGDVVKPLFPLEFSYGVGSFGLSSSDLSSPVESVTGSTETESDEEDYIAGLTRQMAHSTLGEGFQRTDRAFASEKTKGLFLSGSPQSTLCGVGSGCLCKQASSRASPHCQYQVSSPPRTWDLLYAAAGEVARLRMNEESYGGHIYNRGGLLGGPPRKQSPVSVPVKTHQQNLIDHVGFYSQHHHHHHHQSLSYQKLQQASQFQQLKQQQMMKQQQSSSVWVGGPQQTKVPGQYQVGFNNRARSNNTNDLVGTRNNGRTLGLPPSAWPPLQQQPATQQQQQQRHQNGSGMRAVILGASGAKRECAGTGVFLPRRINTPTETRKKTACSTVLLPAKVVQALNLSFDEMGAPLQPRFGSYSQDSDAALRFRNGNGSGFTHQKRNFKSQPGMMNHHEIRLPPEWTY